MYPLKPTNWEHRLLLGYSLTFSLLIICILIFKDGLIVHDDGTEYFKYSSRLYQHVINLDFKSFITTPVFAHWGGVIFGIIPFFTLAEGESMGRMYGLFFALPIILNVFLLYKISLKISSDTRIASISALLFATSFTSFYQVKNALPHDLSISFFLLSTLLTLRNDKKNIYLLLNGLCLFLVFFTYYGYWILTLLGIIFYFFYPKEKNIFIRGVLISIGFWLPLIIFISAGSYYNYSFIDHLLYFSSTIHLGDYNEGYSLPFYFLFYSEGILSIIWAACLIWSLKHLDNENLKWLFATILSIYLLLVLGSNVFQKFVVYGRSTKQFIPILCILSGILLSKLNNKIIITLYLFVLVGFLYNSKQLFQATYPRELDHLYEKTLLGEPPEGMVWHSEVRSIPPFKDLILKENCISQSQRFIMLNLKFFQYDAITPEARDLLKRHTFHSHLLLCKE